MRIVINKTFLTRNGKDIRDCKLPGTYVVNISDSNQRIADKRIRLAEEENAEKAKYDSYRYAKQKIYK